MLIPASEPALNTFLTIHPFILTLIGKMALEFIPVLIMFIFALGLAVTLLVLSNFVGPKRKSASKLSPYECGVAPEGDTKGRFSVKYYLIGALFILFDVETIFLFSWAVIFKDLKMLAFVELIVFLFVIVAGYLYALRKGALEWQ